MRRWRTLLLTGTLATALGLCLLGLSTLLGTENLRAFGQDQEQREVEPAPPEGSHLGLNPAQTFAQAILAPDALAALVSGSATQTKGVDGQIGVFTSTLQGFPTQGSSWGILSSGDVASITNVAGSPSTFKSHSMYGAANQSNTIPSPCQTAGMFTALDVVTVQFQLTVPSGAQTLSFNWKFGTEENPTYKFSSFQDFFTATVIPPGGTGQNIALLPNGCPVSVSNAASFSNQVTGSSTSPSPPFPDPPDVVYNAVTSLMTATFNVAAFVGQTITLQFRIGDATDSAYNSAVFIDNVTFGLAAKAATTTALASSANNNTSVFGQSVTFTATVSPVAASPNTPTGTVTFKDGTTTLGTGTLNASGQATFTTTLLAVAAHSITAEYGSDANFNGSTSGALTQTVNKADTTTMVVSSANPSVSGQSVTFTATVSAVSPGAGTPTGTVQFFDGATSLGTVSLSGGTASIATSALTVGPHSITAVYGGDANFNGSASAALTQTVNQTAATTTTLASSANNNTSVFGQSVTFTATVSPVAPNPSTPTGTVQFFDGATPLGTAVGLSGGTASIATSALTVGSHSITAVYSGDGNFNGSTSAALTQTVNKAATSTVVVSSVNSPVVGQSVTFTATVSPVAPGAGTRTGTVTFKDGTTVLGTGTLNASGQATFPTAALAAGSHSITAEYGGDANFNGSTSPALTQTVNKANTSTVVVASLPPSGSGESVTFTATVSVLSPGAGTPTGTVHFSDGPAVTLVGGQATFQTPLAVGTHLITASYLGNSNFNGSTSSAITVIVLNQPPFFDSIAGQTVIEPEKVVITGVVPGPDNEASQTVTLTATSPDTTLITNLTITPASAFGVTTRTLTYQRFVNANGTTNAGTATVTVTAKDGQLQNNTFSRSFTITLANASTDLTTTVGSTSAPASSTGFVPGEPIVVTAIVTFPTIDINGDGLITSPQDCYRVIAPNPYNVIPRVDGQDADNIPEGPPVTLSDSLPVVCAEPLTLSTNVTLTDWYTNLLTAQGTHNYTLTYVNFARDPELVGNVCPAGTDCFTILQGTDETSGSVTVGDHCSGDAIPSGQGAGGTGCPVADKNTVTLHTVNLGGGASTKMPLGDVVVRVFDRNSPAFRQVVATLTGTLPTDPATKNPDGSLYGPIFEANQGLVGTCVTVSNGTSAGICFAGEAQTGDYLVIVKFFDSATKKSVYVGRPKSPSDFVSTPNGLVAEKDFQIIKVIKKDGSVQYRGGSKTVMTGSILEMIAPDSAVWEGSNSIYPFIFTSDSAWTVDVCARVPGGYQIVGVYDESGALIATTNCVQTFVANQTKIVAFEVVKTGSPEPSLDAEVTVHGPSGKTEVHNVKASDIRKETFDAKLREAKGKKK